jgi:glycerol-3-phosphate dehydrogenase (NAD(P)+)
LVPEVAALDNLALAVVDAEIVVNAVPSYATRHVWEAAAPSFPEQAIWVSATKGIENETLLTMTELFSSLCPAAGNRVAVLSGPSFAAEVEKSLPTAVVVAANSDGGAEPAVARVVQGAFAGPTFRVYTSADVCGVELGGALKNVIAIAAGVSDGLGFGHNTRAALITRGLAEMARLALRRGANPLTLAGLSGLGDLVLTCTGDLSRNRSLGLRLGRGEATEAALGEIHAAVEGVRTVKSVLALAARETVEMPIAEAVHAILYDGLSPRAAVERLMGREMRAEIVGAR